jgi:hypothetical protein
MNVGVGIAGANRIYDLAELLSADLLGSIGSGYRHYTRRRDRSGKMARPIGAIRRTDGTKIRRRLAKPNHDASVHGRLGDMDVGLCSHRSL